MSVDPNVAPEVMAAVEAAADAEAMPKDERVEWDLLASVIRAPTSIVGVLELSAADFWNPAHGFYWRAMLRVQRDGGDPSDANLLRHALKALGCWEGVGRMEGLATLMQGEPSTRWSIDRYAAIVANLAERRRLIESSWRIAQWARDYTVSLTEVRDRTKTDVFGTIGGKSASGKEGLALIHEASDPASVDGQTLATHIPDVSLPVGWPTVIGARAKGGKTSLVIGFVAHAIAARKRVAVFTLEMTRTQYSHRLYANLCRMPLVRVMAGLSGRSAPAYRGDVVELAAASDQIAATKLHIDDGTSLSAEDIHARAMSLAALWGGLDLVVVDHFGKVRHPRRSGMRGDEAQAVSSEVFRRLAKDLGCALALAAQFNRAIESREDRTPRKSDFRECGALEEDAGLLLAPVIEAKFRGADAGPQEAHVYIVDGRDVPPAKIPVQFRGEWRRFEP